MTKEERKDYMKRWRASHKEKQREYAKRYYDKNKDNPEFLSRRNAYLKERYHTDNLFREKRKSYQRQRYINQKNYHPILTDEVVTLN